MARARVKSLRGQNRIIYTGLGTCCMTQYVWWWPAYATLAVISILCLLAVVVWKIIE